MTNSRSVRVLALGASALLLVGVLADWYCVAHHLPYGLGGHGLPSRVGQDWPSHGTALGPPLMPLLALLVATPLAVVRRWWGGIGDVLLVLVGLAELWGTVAEPSFGRVFTSSGFDAAQVLFRVITLAAGLTVVAAGVVDVWSRRGRGGLG